MVIYYPGNPGAHGCSSRPDVPPGISPAGIPLPDPPPSYATAAPLPCPLTRRNSRGFSSPVSFLLPSIGWEEIIFLG